MTMSNQALHRISHLRLNEISSVDNPAQVGATAVLLKRAESETDAAIRKSAATVAEGGKAAYGVEAYEDAMLRRADALAHQWRCTPEQALAKHLTTDPELRVLARAADAARYGSYVETIAKRHGA